jgi:hypothetical protein
MSKFFVIICLILISFPIYSLQYIESSTGLIPPTWEGGRTELEMADINNDGNIDILSIGDHGCPYVNTDEHGVMVWFGNGQGGWSNYMNGNFGYGGIAVGDANNDGYLDIGYGMHHDYSGNDFGDQVMEVALGDGTGMNWTPWDDSLGMNGQTWGMFGTDFADIDNDGDLDIGAVSFGGSDGIHVYQNLMNGTWHQSFGFIGGLSSDEFQFGDINKDGNPDFVATHQYSSVYFGDGNGNFTLAMHNLPPIAANGRYYSVALADVDNDGGQDIGFIYPSGVLKVYIFDEAGDTWRNFSGNLPTSGSFQRINLWDVNGDGYIDVVAQGSSLLKVWTGDGTGNWTEAAQFNTSSPGTGQALTVRGDIDHNGYADIAMVVNESHNMLRVFKETSVPTNLRITPYFPKGSEKFIARSTNFIQWSSAVPNNETSRVSIEFSSQGQNGPWTMLFNNLPNNGTKQWIIPNIVSNNCYLRLKVFTHSDTNSVVTTNPFTIIGNPGINVESNKVLPPNITYLIQNRIIKIPVYLSRPDKVSIKIYSSDGRNLYTKETKLGGGRQNIIIEKQLAEGTYFIDINCSQFKQKAKIIKIKN